MTAVLRAALSALALATALAGCQLADDKPTITDAPFPGDDTGKEDSWLRPWSGGRMLVGEQLTGTFDAARGWIAYEVELAAGPVDLDLADASGGPGLDTLLVVYGPKRASGSYPARAIAVNDDVAPGENLASHLLFDAPVAGTYRVVVSTYDNYAAWPTNVSRGDYRVTIKCPRVADGGWDACGPHLRLVGDACWDDATCGDGNTCEGEVTCPPGTNCLWVREGVCTAEAAFVWIAPRQCGDNPWQLDPQPSDAELGDDELEAVHGWLRAQGVEAIALGRLDLMGDAVCMACSCSRGDTILVEVATEDARRLTEEHGFGWALSDWRAMAPVQCGGNPWEGGGVPDGEVAAVRAWAQAHGAPVATVGVVRPVDPMAVCLACSCPRGDLLVATPADGTDPAMLGALGFGPLQRTR